MSTSLEKQPCQKLQNRVSGSGRLKTSMIMSWLINSMNNDIGENFLLFETAKDIWDAAKETYSSSENTSELFQVESALHDFRQGKHNIQADCGTKETVQGGFSEVRREESRKKVMMGSKEQPTPTLDASALAARSFNSSGGDRQKWDRPWCDYCKKLGHYKEACWKLHGKPADWKPKPRFDRDGRAHVAANSESTSVPEPSPFSKEQMEMLQKLLSQVGSGSTTGTAFTANRGGMKSWIVDTGASDHMTGDAAILQNYKPSNGHSSVHIADGSNAELCSGLYLLPCGRFSNQVSQASCVQSQSLLESFNSVSNSKGKAILTATYLINHMPSRVLTFQSPLQHLLKKFPHTRATSSDLPFKAFGCTAFVHVYPQNRSKFAPRANKCIFLGYSPTQKGYKCYSPTNKRFYTTMDVSFFEHVFFYPKSHVQGESMNEHQVWESLLEAVPFSHSESPNPSQSAPTELSTPMPSSVQPAQPTNVPSPMTIQSPTPIQPIAHNLLMRTYNLPEENIGEDRAGEVSIPSIDDSSLPIALRKGVKRCTDHPIGIMLRMKGYHHLTEHLLLLDDTQVPNTIQEAFKILEWKKAVQDEIDALEKNGTWTITDLPVGKRPVGILLSLVVNQDWCLQQLDIKNVFLNGDLEEEVYMEIPPGFEGSMAKNQNLKKYLSEEFEVKDLGNLKYFLGMEVARSRKGIVVSQRKYILDLLKEIGMLGCKPIDTPMDSQKKLGIEKESTPVDRGRYQRLVGRLIYLSHTRPDIGFAGNLVTWRSKKQSVVARSSAEAECKALAQGICEGIWIKRVLSKLGQTSSSPILMMCDNQAAISIAKNPVHHDRTKHVEIDRHFITEKVTSETVKLNYVPTKHQTADILTKALPRPNFKDLTCKLGLYDIYSPA
ncbi:Copia protein [Vitis vinifera]|uniref:Copia protein n=1 Tax=Vitis vinifera TaxID=29760 RepID=A0A438FTE1_VITVI|nr:Copia protein [Vitis vinifera]